MDKDYLAPKRFTPDEIMSLDMPYKYRDFCQDDYAQFLLCKRVRNNVTDSEMLYSMPLSDLFTSCKSLRNKWRRCQQHRERELFQKLRKQFQLKHDLPEKQRKMRPNVMLEAVFQRIFFANFQELEKADTELHYSQKYLKIVAGELKFTLSDLELVLHENLSSVGVNSKDKKVEHHLFRMFVKQSVGEYSDSTASNIKNILTRVRPDSMLSQTVQLLLLADQMYHLFTLHEYNRCLRIFDQWNKQLTPQNGREVTFIKSRIWTGALMLKLRMNESELDGTFQKTIRLRQACLDSGLLPNSDSYLKKLVYIKLKFVETLVENKKHSKACLKLQDCKDQFGKDQQGFQYLRGVLMARVSNMNKTIDNMHKQQTIKLAESHSSSDTLPPTPRNKERTRSLKPFKLRSKSKNQLPQTKSIYVDLYQPFYRVKRASSNNPVPKSKLDTIYKSINAFKENKLVGIDINLQLNSIRQSIINRGISTIEVLKETKNSFRGSSKSSIFKPHLDSRLSELQVLAVRLPSLLEISFVYFNFSVASFVTVKVDKNQEEDMIVLSITVEGNTMKQQFGNKVDSQDYDSEWSTVKYLFRKYLRADQIFREIDKHTRIPDQDLNQEAINLSLGRDLQTAQINQMLQIKELVRTFILFNFCRMRDLNGNKRVFLRRYNWQNVRTKRYLQKEIVTGRNLEEAILGAGHFDQLFSKFPQRIIGLQYILTKEGQMYTVNVYFKRQFFENYINRLTRETVKQAYMHVDIGMHLPAGKGSLAYTQVKCYNDLQIPLSFFLKDQGIGYRQMTRYLLDIFVNYSYDRHITSYLLRTFNQKTAINSEGELLLLFDNNDKVLFDYDFDHQYDHGFISKQDANVNIKEVDFPLMTKVINSKRKHSSYIAGRLSSMSPPQQLQTMQDSHVYTDKKVTRYFGGILYVVQIRIIKQRNKTGRKWDWAISYYLSTSTTKSTSTISFNSADLKVMAPLFAQGSDQLSLEDRAAIISQCLTFVHKSPYLSLCFKRPQSAFTFDNSLKFIKPSRSRIGLVSCFKRSRYCLFSKVLKLNSKYIVVSVYQIKWANKSTWEAEFSLINGETWVCQIATQSFLYLACVCNCRSEAGQYQTNARQADQRFWSKVFSGKVQLDFNRIMGKNYLQLRGLRLKLEQRLSLVCTQLEQRQIQIDIRLLSRKRTLRNFFQNQQNLVIDKKCKLKIKIYQDEGVSGLQMEYKELESMFKFQNNGMWLSENKKAFRMVVAFITEKIHLFAARATKKTT